MEVIVVIGSLRDRKWTHLRKSLKDSNFIEISNDLIYTSWNSQYIKTSSLLLDNIPNSCNIDSIVDRPWFLNLVQRWCSNIIVDYSAYTSDCRNFEVGLFQFLSQFSVKKSICLYGIAHHVWNNLVESSLLNLGVESIKFYPLLDTNYSILLTGSNEVNYPYQTNQTSGDLDPNISEIHDALVDTLIESRPKYTSDELKYGNYYIDTDRKFLVKAALLALGDLKRFIKSFYIKPYYQFAFSPTLVPSRYSIISKSINLVSQSLYISAYKQISQPVCLDSLRGQLLLFAHFQPEATSSPEGGTTWNHLELIAQLKCKFPHLQIFYKEHPASALAFDSSKSPTDVGLCRSVAYLDALQALGVKVLDLDCSVTIENMKIFNIIPVTIGGTIALQCAINGHYAIYSGHPWYEHFSSDLPLHKLDTLNADSFCEQIKDKIMQKPEDLLPVFIDSMKAFLVPNVFRFGLGLPKSDSRYVTARIKLMQALIEN